MELEERFEGEAPEEPCSLRFCWDESIDFIIHFFHFPAGAQAPRALLESWYAEEWHLSSFGIQVFRRSLPMR